MSRLRWWLARKAAPARIIADPFPENPTGVWVVIRNGAMLAVVSASTFRMQHQNSIWRQEFGPGHRAYLSPRGRRGRFVGTFGEDA